MIDRSTFDFPRRRGLSSFPACVANDINIFTIIVSIVQPRTNAYSTCQEGQLTRTDFGARSLIHPFIIIIIGTIERASDGACCDPYNTVSDIDMMAWKKKARAIFHAQRSGLFGSESFNYIANAMGLSASWSRKMQICSNEPRTIWEWCHSDRIHPPMLMASPFDLAWPPGSPILSLKLTLRSKWISSKSYSTCLHLTCLLEASSAIGCCKLTNCNNARARKRTRTIQFRSVIYIIS